MTYIALKISDDIDDLLVDITPTKSHQPVLKTHCRRELMHEVWCLLLDAEFLAAYKSGIVITCPDGVQ